MTAPATNIPTIDPEEMLAGIREWVEIESPSDDRDAVNRIADLVEAQCAEFGLVVDRIPGEAGWGDLIRARSPGHDGAAPGLLVLCHYDTVHPIGVKDAENPIRREGDKFYGPGSYDMKAGAYLALYAYRHLARKGERSRLPVTFLFMPDEEVGTPFGRKHIEAEAANAKYALVTEPARDGGRVVLARKGVARFTIRATGRPAHAGVNHEAGRSAIREIARQILEIEAMTDYERGVTLNVGMVAGGTGVNVVPRECRIDVDMRVLTEADGEEMTRRIYALTPHDPDVALEIEGGMNRPPYEMTAESEALFEIARAASREHGLDLRHTTVSGGGSDGNFTAALGVPTLDGMGADGAGAHTLSEHILVSSLKPRAETWVKLFERLE
ncbi:M20 family metallopeptidase [Pikeienuella sp. HZG-20]|uniref:M20 family metallopeptidase n=1 Tax=Paludibacillus litoralis TaxID=3133267 RepID=UPI0030EE1BC9